MIETRISQREKDTLLKMAYNNYTEMKKEVRLHQGMKEITVLSLTGIWGYPVFSPTDTLYVRRIAPRKRNQKRQIGISKVAYDGDMFFLDIRFVKEQKEYHYFNELLEETRL